MVRKASKINKKNKIYTVRKNTLSISIESEKQNLSISMEEEINTKNLSKEEIDYQKSNTGKISLDDVSLKEAIKKANLLKGKLLTYLSSYRP